MDTPSTAPTRITPSAALPVHFAEISPRGIPSTNEKSRAAVTSSIDAGARSLMSDSTDWCVWIDVPQSPLSTPLK